MSWLVYSPSQNLDLACDPILLSEITSSMPYFSNVKNNIFYLKVIIFARLVFDDFCGQMPDKVDAMAHYFLSIGSQEKKGKKREKAELEEFEAQKYKV